MELQEVNKTTSLYGLLLTARENTWSNQRQKRRNARKNEASAATVSSADSSICRPSCSSSENVTSIANDSEYRVPLGSTQDITIEKQRTKGPRRTDTRQNNSNEDFAETTPRTNSVNSRDILIASSLSGSKCCNSTVNGNFDCHEACELMSTEVEVLQQTDGDCLSASGEKRQHHNDCVKRLHSGGDKELNQTVKKPRLDIQELSKRSEPILEASLVMRSRVPEVQIELALVQGAGCRDLLHQVLQHLKNGLK